MSTTVTVITPEDLLRMPDEGKGYELVNGELKELNMSARSCRIGGQVYLRLEEYCQTRAPGWAFPPETGYRCFPDDRGRVRKPDSSFIEYSRLTREHYEEEGFIEVVPDLVAEVVSPNDNAEGVEEKIAEWIDAGVKVVWLITPATRTIRVHRGDGGYAFLRTGDTLTAPDVLPGFSVPVAELFRLPGEPVPPAATPVT